jgi:hypothetical protein
MSSPTHLLPHTHPPPPPRPHPPTHPHTLVLEGMGRPTSCSMSSERGVASSRAWSSALRPTLLVSAATCHGAASRVRTLASRDRCECALCSTVQSVSDAVTLRTSVVQMKNNKKNPGQLRLTLDCRRVYSSSSSICSRGFGRRRRWRSRWVVCRWQSIWRGVVCRGLHILRLDLIRWNGQALDQLNWQVRGGAGQGRHPRVQPGNSITLGTAASGQKGRPASFNIQPPHHPGSTAVPPHLTWSLIVVASLLFKFLNMMPRQPSHATQLQLQCRCQVSAQPCSWIACSTRRGPAHPRPLRRVCSRRMSDSIKRL